MEKSLYDFLSRPSAEVAPELLGCILEREVDGQIVRVKIVEVEAYDQMDAASHSYSGKTERSEIMFGNPGHLYVYFTYGMHYCCNIVTGPEGYGSAVLVRAVEPIEGIDIMEGYRGRVGYEVANGPAKLCQALAINKRFNGHDLAKPPIKLKLQKPVDPKFITQTTRIGISKAKGVPWRFYLTANPYVSKQ